MPLHVPEVHVPPAQHGSPVKPHEEHWGVPPELAHTTPVPVQALPGQHGSPRLPHDSQKPPEDTQTCWMVPVGEHEPPMPTHFEGVADVSQQPPGQLSPLQQGWPAPPHD